MVEEGANARMRDAWWEASRRLRESVHPYAALQLYGTHLLSLSSGLRHLLSLAVASWRMLERFQPYVLDHFGDHVTVSVCVEHYTVLYCDAVALSLQTPL